MNICSRNKSSLNSRPSEGWGPRRWSGWSTSCQRAAPFSPRSPASSPVSASPPPPSHPGPCCSRNGLELRDPRQPIAEIRRLFFFFKPKFPIRLETAELRSEIFWYSFIIHPGIQVLSVWIISFVTPTTTTFAIYVFLHFVREWILFWVFQNRYNDICSALRFF